MCFPSVYFASGWCDCVGYQVEKRKAGGDWEKVNDFPIAGESATVPDLDEGKEYEFRVAAITGAGVGDYSLNTAPVKVCEKKGLQTTFDYSLRSFIMAAG